MNIKGLHVLFIGVFIGKLIAIFIFIVVDNLIIPRIETDTIYKPIFTTDTVKINGRDYLRLNTKEDTTYSHYDKYGSDEIVWYERIELRSDLKPVEDR